MVKVPPFFFICRFTASPGLFVGFYRLKMILSMIQEWCSFVPGWKINIYYFWVITCKFTRESLVTQINSPTLSIASSLTCKIDCSGGCISFEIHVLSVSSTSLLTLKPVDTFLRGCAHHCRGWAHVVSVIRYSWRPLLGDCDAVLSPWSMISKLILR